MYAAQQDERFLEHTQQQHILYQQEQQILHQQIQVFEADEWLRQSRRLETATWLTYSCVCVCVCGGVFLCDIWKWIRNCENEKHFIASIVRIALFSAPQASQKWSMICFTWGVDTVRTAYKSLLSLKLNSLLLTCMVNDGT